MTEGDPDVARGTVFDAIESIEDAKGDDEGEAGERAFTLAFAILAGWLSGVRESQGGGNASSDCMAWVRATLGDEAAEIAEPASGLLGGGGSRDLTVQELVDELDEDLLPALIWLAAGSVVQFGQGDAEWLKRFDVSVD